jgi:hypothetical protein
MEALGTLDLYDLLILPVVAAMNYKRHTAVRFTSRRSVSKMGNQSMSARDEIFVGWGFDESGRDAHDLPPTKGSKPVGPACKTALE